jgi:hypothetical protein
MRWAALYRRPPILRGVSASQIRADHAANQARITARYSPELPSSPQLRGEAEPIGSGRQVRRGAPQTLRHRHPIPLTCALDRDTSPARINIHKAKADGKRGFMLELKGRQRRWLLTSVLNWPSRAATQIQKSSKIEMEIMCGQIESGFCALPGRPMSRSISAAKI